MFISQTCYVFTLLKCFKRCYFIDANIFCTCDELQLSWHYKLTWQDMSWFDKYVSYVTVIKISSLILKKIQFFLAIVWSGRNASIICYVFMVRLLTCTYYLRFFLVLILVLSKFFVINNFIHKLSFICLFAMMRFQVILDGQKVLWIVVQ